MNITNITNIATRMAAKIPGPKPKVAKPAKSWRTIKLNQYLTNKIPVSHVGRVVPAGTLWHTAAVASNGIDIATVSIKPVKFHWTLKNWEEFFTRVRKPTKAQLTDILVKEIQA